MVREGECQIQELNASLAQKRHPFGCLFHVKNQRGLLRLEVSVNREYEEHHVRCDHLNAEVHQFALAHDQIHDCKHRGNADEVGDENGFGHCNVCLSRSQQQNANHEEGVSDAHVHVGGEMKKVGVADIGFNQGHFGHRGRKEHGYEANERLVSTEDGECGGSFHKKSVRFGVKLK